LAADQRAELQALVNSPEVSASVATRAGIVLWKAEGRAKVEIAALAGVSRPTVDLWLSRFGEDEGVRVAGPAAGRTARAGSGGGPGPDRGVDP
jgi:hypothetical protein